MRSTLIGALTGAVFLIGAPVSAHAQCTGIFPPNTVCGNSTGSPAPPKATAGAAASGTANQMPFYQSSGNSLIPTSTLPLSFDLTGGQSSHDQQPNGGEAVWKRLGTAIDPTVTNCGATQNIAQERGMLYEGNPKILTSYPNVFKMWYHAGTGANSQTNYAESGDGINWTCYASNPVIGQGWTQIHGMTKSGATYVTYLVNVSTSNVDRFTSSDGITWTLANSNVLTHNTQGWESGTLVNPFVFLDGGTWTMLYQSATAGSGFPMGLATSSDGITWTKYVSNPVLTNAAGAIEGISGVWATKIGSTYWLWGGNNLPSDTVRYSSSDLHTWTRSPAYICTFCRGTLDEGVNTLTNGGQSMDDPTLLQVGNQTYLYGGTANNQSTGPFKIKVAVANMPISQLVITNEGEHINFNSAIMGNPLAIGGSPNAGEQMFLQYGQVGGSAFVTGIIGFNAFYDITQSQREGTTSSPGFMWRWINPSNTAAAAGLDEILALQGGSTFTPVHHKTFTSGGALNDDIIVGPRQCWDPSNVGGCPYSISANATIGDLARFTFGASDTGGDTHGWLYMRNIEWDEHASPGNNSGSALMWDDSTSHRPKFNWNAGNDMTVPAIVAQGTSSVGGNAITAGTCDTVVTTAATNAATTDSISWAFAAAPGTSWPFATVQAYLTSGNVNFLVCIPGATGKTPAAATLNWSVIR
jgi:hypothetical protein